MRWSHAESLLKLPVNSKTAYAVALDLRIPDQAVDSANGVYLGTERIIDLAGKTGIVAASGTIPPQDQDRVILSVRVKAWRPKDTIPDSKDGRQLGVAVRAVTMKAEGSPAPEFNANTGG